VIELYRAWEQIVDGLLSTVESLLVVDPQHDRAGALRRIVDAVRRPYPRRGQLRTAPR
jgi:hypothetical protein